MNRSGKIRVLTVVAGILAALAIVFSQVFFFQAESQLTKPIETEQESSSTSSGEVFISPPSFSLPSATHIEIQHEFSFLFEILFEKNEKEELVVDMKLPVTKLSRTLFRVIISPNAP